MRLSSPLNRRRFLAAAALAAAGCGRQPGPPAPDAATLERIRADLADRVGHLAALEAARPAITSFTTPPAGVDILKLAPELKGVLKLAHRLHPRFDPAVTADQSHLGGPVWLPAGDAGPVTAAGRPLVPVLQLLAANAPPQLLFKPGTDVLQLFWDARFTDKLPRTPVTVELVWRKQADLAGGAVHPLSGLGARPADPAWQAEGLWPGYVPVPCRLAAKRVLEFPSADVLPAVMRDKLFPLLPGGAAAYRDTLSVAAGTKAGGYAPAQPNGLPPACPTCRWGMDYVLSVAEAEWADAGPRWKPTGAADTPAERRAAGLSLGPLGAVHVFACRRCEAWPAAAVG